MTAAHTPKFFASLPGERTGARILSRDEKEIGLLYPQTDPTDLLTRLNSHAALVAALEDLHKRHALTVKECGGCDHSVGICWCEDIRALDNAEAALKQARGELNVETNTTVRT